MPNHKLEIISCSGRSDVAEVFVARINGPGAGRGDRMVEFVDGLDVRSPREEKWIINISTQYGCAVKCLFCDAGGDFKGNVPAQVMLRQVEHVLGRHPARLREKCRKLKVHFARMGEPALNPEVPDVMERLPLLIPTPGLWVCVATIVPQGSEKWFERVFDVKHNLYQGRFQMQFSVNSTDTDWRKRLMPFPHRNLSEIADLGKEFWSEGDRKVVLNFALAREVPVEANVIQNLFDPRVFAVKLTPLNPTARGAEQGLQTVFTPQDAEAARALAADLQSKGFDVIVSMGDGREDEIGSNCGQAVQRLRSIPQGVA